MFGAIKELRKKVKQFNQEKVIDKTLKDSTLQAEIIDLNQKQLYDEGIQADGTPTGQYAKITKEFYKPLAAQEGRDGRTDHVTLKDTGSLYDSMKVKAVKEGIVIEANDENGVFERMRLDEALGLTSESKSEILPTIQQDMIDELRKQISK